MMAIHSSQVASQPPTRAGRTDEDESAGAATVMSATRVIPRPQAEGPLRVSKGPSLRSG